MSKPLVSVSISFWNDESTLADAITSVMNQSFCDWELLLIDDGSTDRSVDVARGFTCERVSLRSDGANKGLVYRLNEAIRRASGKYYARMDADDVMHTDRLLKQVQFLEAHPEVDVVDAGMYVMNRNGEITGIRAETPPDRWTLRDVIAGRTLHHATVLGRVEWFRAHPYDAAYFRAEDIELWCRTVEESRFARLIEPLYFVREGKINVNSYRNAQVTVRLIVREFGGRRLTWFERQRLYIRSFAKSATYTIAGWSGMQELLTQSRNRTLDLPGRAVAEASLRRALRRT